MRIPNDVPAFHDDGTIYIVAAGAFFSGQRSNGTPVTDNPAFRGLSQMQFQESVVIHEFMHLMRIVGPDSEGQRYTLPNGRVVAGSQGISEAIRDTCFR